MFSCVIGNFQGGVSIDTKGNIAIQWSTGAGATGGTPGASISSYQNITNAPSIEHLEGSGYQLGGSLGVPVYQVPLSFSGDLNIIPDSTLNKTYFGLTANEGFGTPGYELHFEFTETYSLEFSKLNIFETTEKVYGKVMEW